MVLREVTVSKVDGMTREDAQTIVQRSMRYISSILFEWKSSKVNAKSLMGVIAMNLKHGDKLIMIINGEDQNEAVEELEHLFTNNFRY